MKPKKAKATKKTQPLRAWHFVGATLRDGRPIPPDGEWLAHPKTEPLIMCKRGLHASRSPWAALQYAPGNTLCLVEVAGEIKEDADKLVARRRRIIKRIDVTQLLRRFAADQALSVAHLWEMPPSVRQYLTTLDENIRSDASYAASGASYAASGASSGASYAAAAAAYATRAASSDASYAAGAAADATRASAAAYSAARAASYASSDASYAAGAAASYAATRAFNQQIEEVFA